MTAAALATTAIVTAMAADASTMTAPSLAATATATATAAAGNGSSERDMPGLPLRSRKTDDQTAGAPGYSQEIRPGRQPAAPSKIFLTVPIVSASAAVLSAR